MKKLIAGLCLALLMMTGSSLFNPSTVYAAVPSACRINDSFLSFPTWYEYLEVGPKTLKDKYGDPIGEDTCAITGPQENGEFSFNKALPRIGLAIVDILLRIVGLVSVGFVIYGGFRYITSQGEPDATKKALATVVNALIGMAIAIFAVTIVSFMGSTLWK